MFQFDSRIKIDNILDLFNCSELWGKGEVHGQNGEETYYPTHNINMDTDMQSKYSPPKEAHWLLRRIYILSWIGAYDRSQAMADLIAGITLGLTIIPQSIAYASLAGLSSEYGLYSAFVDRSSMCSLAQYHRYR